MTTYEQEMIGPCVDEPPAESNVERGFWPLLVITFIWGALVSFGALPDDQLSRFLLQGCALAGAGVLFSAYYPRALAAWTGSLCGWMLFLHAMFACCSGVLHDTLYQGLVRYILLVPAISLFVAATELGASATKAVRIGLTLAPLPFIGYHLAHLDPSQLLNRSYRLSLFLNTNGVSFISAMCAISLFEMTLRWLIGKRFLAAAVGMAGVIACVVLQLATKTRTAAVATFVGFGVTLYLVLGPKRTVIVALIVSAMVAIAAWNTVVEGAETLTDAFGLFGGSRDISSGTGRFAGWDSMVRELWLPNFFLGIGPLATETIQETAGIPGAHSGYMQSLVETGVLGTTPLLLILAFCARRAWRLRLRPEATIAIALLAAGLVEAIGETMFFSMGNPGSLMFLWAVAVLTSRRYAPRPELLEVSY